MPKISIEFSASKDSVIKYVKEIEGNNLTEISKNEFLLFDDKQAFITKESLKENTDKKPYRWLYTHEGSLASLWNLKFISVNDQQSKIEFEIKTVLTNPKIEYDSQNSNEFHVYKNTIYLATGSGFVYAISLKDGEIYWQSSPIKITKENKQTNFFNQELPISDDYIFANYNGTVYKINRYNGKFEWSQTIGNYGHYNYSFDEKNLYKTGMLECFVVNKKTGEVEKIINNSEGNTFYSPHAYDDKNKIIILNSVGYNLLTDKVLWKQNISMDYLFLENESIYATNNVASSVYKLDIKTGKILWQNDELESNNTRVEDLYNLKNEVLIDRISNFYSENEKARQLIFLDKKSGELNLILTIGDKIISKPIIYQNKIFSFGYIK